MKTFYLKQKVYEMYKIEANSFEEAQDILFSGEVLPFDAVLDEVFLVSEEE